MKKGKLVSVIALCLLITGCGIKNSSAVSGNENVVTNEPTQISEDNSISEAAENASISNNADSDNDTKTTDEAKLKLSHNEMLNYNGYMDAVNENWFGTKYELSDYDGDGINDRVYREASFSDSDKKSEGLVPDKVSFRIDFGNGDSLELGTFDDTFLGIKILGADLTGDGNNEIIFLGHHDAMTEPESYSEIAVFQRTGTKYEKMSLPAPVNDTSGDTYLVGYPIYAKNDTDSKITLFSDYADYEETIQIERTDYNHDERYQDNDLISSYAWGTGTEQYGDKTALVLYQRIGGRDYYKNNLKIVLVWQDGEFKPVKMETVDKHYEW